MTPTSFEALQKDVCRQYGAEFIVAPGDSKLGISLNVRDGAMPLNGLRHPPVGDTCGWYIYAGEEQSDAPDFFEPLHVRHLEDWCPRIVKYLGLPPGWRFLVAGDYEDVWYDGSLLEI
ncbi:hypothetical protein [Pelagibius sp.]|uniref:immunity protein Imm33 domain-containing protein n=1 Tax=Pelagibius sp. TaxID=1931238 RepID=UPI00261B1588|nr:hypothetical protein [Pelagibius sp.]